MKQAMIGLFFASVLCLLGGCGPHTLSDAELIHQLQTDRTQQVRTYWKSARPFDMDAHGFGADSPELRFTHTVTPEVVRQLALRVRRDPRLLFDQLSHRDPEVVITVMWLYDRYFFQGAKFQSVYKDEFAGLLRNTLIGHRDLRLRWLGYKWLIQNDCFTFDDLSGGLSDRDDAIRGWLVWRVHDVFDTQRQEYEHALHRLKFRICRLLIDHLNDVHPQVRAGSAQTLYGYMNSHTGHHYGLPASFPQFPKADVPINVPTYRWIHAEWHERDRMQKAIAKWWEEHTHEVLGWMQKKQQIGQGAHKKGRGLSTAASPRLP